jgi:hypothetical protein
MAFKKNKIVMWVLNNNPRNSKTLDVTMSKSGAKPISEIKNVEMKYVNFSFLTSLTYG